MGYYMPCSYNDLIANRWAATDPNFNKEYRDGVKRRQEEMIRKNQDFLKKVETATTPENIKVTLKNSLIHHRNKEHAIYMKNGKLWYIDSSKGEAVIDDNKELIVNEGLKSVVEKDSSQKIDNLVEELSNQSFATMPLEIRGIIIDYLHINFN